MQNTDNKNNLMDLVQKSASLPHTMLRATAMSLSSGSMMYFMMGESPLGVKAVTCAIGMTGGYLITIQGHTHKESLNREKKKSAPTEWNAKQAMSQTLVTTLAVTCGAVSTSAAFFGKKLAQFAQQADIMLPPMIDIMTDATLGTTMLMLNEVCKFRHEEKYKNRIDALQSAAIANGIDEIGTKTSAPNPHF